MTDPVVDVVIPVHTDRRPIARATSSVLSTASVATRVTVVCHNVSPNDIAAALGTWVSDPRVRLLHLEDGLMSPAGPLNAGLDAATGEFTALLGSDDEYEPGAIDAWVAVARHDEADVVIPPLRISPGATTRSPPTRPFRKRKLDGVKDRLAYRTVQLGLVSRDRFGGVRMTPGLRTGEDVIQGASLWYSDARISLARRAPGYLIHQDDPAGRTSASPKPAAESLGFLDAVLAQEFIASLTQAQKESFAVKLLRTHVMDILGASLRAGAPMEDRAVLAIATRRILDFAPIATGILSRREARIVEGLLNTADPDLLSADLAVLTDYRRPSNLFPASIRQLMHREATPRFLASIAVMR
ncbi:glycosyltransferase family 2 protein [Demequina sp. TTPB684]|uniref:glycosyltransferase family A protein n=1 Tax=unclassified Demequina TaxID=2620311 RepID=UPI001CF5EA6E|nr:MULTISPECIES: glycosyltransferase family A protein [unclassified Demequina]MCB2413613.1 glycosyltransferase family 2 protein [Demequina sp. TTPB684]UPU88263.1 glycosyltransferase family 2 protein [Demequina sp. TMPB413]